MKPTNIETSYGKFPTMIHYEKYWKKKVAKATLDGFNMAIKIIGKDLKLHKKMFKQLYEVKQDALKGDSE